MFQLMEVNRRWKQEYDLLKTKYVREKSEYEEENHSLKIEVSRLREELSRLAHAVNEGSHMKIDCCNSDQARQGNVDELIKEQVLYKLFVFHERNFQQWWIPPPTTQARPLYRL